MDTRLAHRLGDNRRMGMVRSQHYVPQFYLRGFVGQDGQLGVYDKHTGNHFRTAPGNIACENFFYAVDGVSPGQPIHSLIERYLYASEDQAAVTHERLLGELKSGSFDRISDPDQDVLATHVALQYLRTKEARASFVELVEKLREVHVRAMLEVEKPELADASFRLRIDEQAHSAIHAWVLLHGEPLKRIRDALLSHLWVIARDGTGRTFYTSDHPVTLHSGAPRPLKDIGFLTHGVEIMYPLSPNYILLIVDRSAHPCNLQDDRKLLAEPASDENLDYYNSMRLRDAHRFVFMRDSDFAFADRYRAAFPDSCTPDQSRVKVYVGRWSI